MTYFKHASKKTKKKKKCTLLRYSTGLACYALPGQAMVWSTNTTCSSQVYKPDLKIYTAIGYPAKFRVVLEKIIIVRINLATA